MDLIKKLIQRSAALLIIVSLFIINNAFGQYIKVEYPASTQPGELKLGVTYTMWIPEGVKTIRGIIVHQHGAGAVAAQSGENAAYDLHWQALAKKWDCALLTPSYHVIAESATGGSQLWYDPRKGSEKAFLNAINDFAAKSNHPELSVVPWVLWGHSAGGYWSDVMTMLHPERVAMAWLRSGTIAMWNDKPGLNLATPAAAYDVPTVCNPGIQENTNFIGIGEIRKFHEYSAKKAPVCLATDPLTGHWTGNSRYLAIPFIDACLAMRLPEKGSKSQKLRPINLKAAWYAQLPDGVAKPAASFKGDLNEAVWLPDEAVAKMWTEFVKTGQVSDNTPPPAPFDVKVKDLGDKGSEITWNADADFESGVQNFVVLRDGQELGNLPAVNLVRFKVRPNFQAGWTESFNDAPAVHIPEMKFIDAWPKDNKTHAYSVITVNTVGLRSKPSAEVMSTSTK